MENRDGLPPVASESYWTQRRQRGQELLSALVVGPSCALSGKGSADLAGTATAAAMQTASALQSMAGAVVASDEQLQAEFAAMMAKMAARGQGQVSKTRRTQT